MEGSLLDISQDELIVKETQHRDSPATFSKNLVDHFHIIGYNIQTGSETINPTENINIQICMALRITKRNLNCYTKHA